MTQSSPVRVFISYSHADDALRRKLEKHLVALQNQNVIEVWSDRQIDAGTEWEPSIREKLETAEIILLLVSPDFLASDFCQRQELKRAMERHGAGHARVIPVFLKACNWKGTVFGRLQGVPEDARPVTNFGDRDRAFTMIAEAVRKAATDLRSPTRSRVQGDTREQRAEAPASQPIGANNAAKGAQAGGAPHVERERSPGMSDAAAGPEWKPGPTSPLRRLETLLSFRRLSDSVRTMNGLLVRAGKLPHGISFIRSHPRLFIGSATAFILALIGLFLITGQRLQIKEKEPNDIFSSSTEMTIGQSALSSLSDEKDIDFYRVRIPNGFAGSADILLNNQSGSDGFAPQMTIYDDSFDKIKNVSSTNRGSYLAFVLQINKGVRVFYVSVANNRYSSGKGSDSGPYQLSVLQHS